MTIPYQQQAYGSSQGTVPVPAFLFEKRDPTPHDIRYPLYAGWVNTITYAIWYLEAFHTLSGQITAQWRAVGPIVVNTVSPTTADYLYPIGQTWINTANDTYWGLVNVTGVVATWVDLGGGASPGLLTLTGNAGGPVAGDIDRNINLLGAAGQVVVTGDGGDNTLTISLVGGSTAIDSIEVDAHTAPGTDPVLPTSAGLITVTGAQVANGTTANVIRTDSIAANTYQIEVQRSAAVVSSNAPSNGVSHFNSAHFTVDGNGFVSSLTSPTGFQSINVQVFTSNGTYTPTPGMTQCWVQVVGSGGGGGSLGNEGAQSASGGGAGGYASKVLSSSTVGSSQVITVGVGGAAASNGNTSQFGGLVFAFGGGAGGKASTNNLTGGAGGGSSGGDINSVGGCGGYGVPANIQSSFYSLSGMGGNSFFGGGANSVYNTSGTPTNINGLNGSNYGGGGSGASSGASGPCTGGSGASGVVIVTEYII